MNSPRRASIGTLRRSTSDAGIENAGVYGATGLVPVSTDALTWVVGTLGSGTAGSCACAVGAIACRAGGDGTSPTVTLTLTVTACGGRTATFLATTLPLRCPR